MSHVGLPIGSTSTLLRASSASTSLAQASRLRASVLSVPATRENKPSLIQASSTRLDKLAESPLGQILRARLISFIAQTGLDPSISNSSALHQLLSAAARLSIDFTPQILGMRHDDLTTEFARRLYIIKSSLDRVRRAQQAEGLVGTSFSVQLHMASAREPNAALLVSLSWIDVRCWEPLCVAISVNHPRVVALRRLDLLGLKSSHIHETRHTSAQEGHHLELFVRKLLVDPQDDRKTSNATPRQGQAVDSVSNERDQDQDQDAREQGEPGLDEASNNSGIEAARALVAEAQVLWQRLTGDAALWAAIASQMASPWTSPLLSTSIGSSPWHLLQALLLEQAAIQNAVSTYEPPIDEDLLAQWLDDGWWAQLADLEAVLNAALSLQFAATVSPTSALVMLSLLRARFLLSQPRLGVIDGFDEERMSNAQDPRGLTFHRRDVACEVIDGFIDYLLPLDDGLTATSAEVGIGHLGFVAQALRERLVRELDRLVDDDQEFDQDHLIAMFCDPVFVSLGPRLMEMHPAYKNVFWRGLPLFERAFMQEFNRLGVDPGAAASEDGNGNTGNQGASVSAHGFHELQNTQGRHDSHSLHFEGPVPPSASTSDTQAGKNTQAPSNFPRSGTSRPIAMANWAPLTDNTVPDLLVSLASNSGVPPDDFASLAPDNDELRRWLQLSVMWGTMHPTGTPLRDPFLASTRGAVFEFWRQHGAKFPTVQRLASRFLAMPAPLNMTPSLATLASGAGEAFSRSAEIQHLSKLSAQAVSALEPVTEISDALPREAFDLAHEFLGEDLCAPASSVADLTTMPFV
ncbi:Hypothetical Protein FCC1311_089482 [Hondaea fermentalgiana]|uniref:Uncharacterized protein n=1 Tax=Hondaea fermentalgiana TaxID=2315210 RepID=A0A2R5GVN6_9STRA|nr:Hypothetical Protein FCC1311_089482 [Hondaea fermentalgiana]|eukprot:GBG32723.1 Hypothetical Protein FCC1311_089482 [Hondaea fermentalgiana]